MNLETKKMNALFNKILKAEGVEMAEIEPYWGHVFDSPAGEFLVLTEEEADGMAAEYIKETASFFNASFLSSMTGLASKVFEALVDENEAVWAIIEGSCGAEAFVEEAIRWDGRGHFLSSYDGEEIEVEVDGEWFFIYRTN